MANEMQGSGYLNAVGINPELKKYLCEQEAVKNGVEICYESILTGVYYEENKVTGIQWFGIDGMKRAAGKVIIDCTADAQVCSLANCKLHSGREIDGQGQPYSNVQIELLNNQIEFYHFTDCGYINHLDGKQYSDAHVHSASLPNYLWDKYEENRRMLGFAPLLGLREGRFIEGEENITLEDYQNDKISDKPLFYAYSNIDNHGKDVAFESEMQQDWTVAASLWGINFSLPIPMGALLPKGFEGIITAGRCIAMNHDIAPCIRMRRSMQKCGEAAALVALLAIEKGISLKEVPYVELATLLKETKCLNEENNVGTEEVISHPHKIRIFKWMTSEEEIKNGLSTSKPGIAIWSAKRLGEKIKADLKLWISDNDEHISRNSALALGLIGDVDALPMLRHIAQERDDFLPETSRKFNQLRAHSAIYLIGKLKDRDSVTLLTDIFMHPESWPNKNKIYNEFIYNDEEYYFQYFSQSMMALIKIGDEHVDLREEISRILKQRVFAGDFNVIITFKGGKGEPYSHANKIRKIVNSKLMEWKIK
ncbi:FAD-dependent oxidoreductase [Clostridium bowmanii]|nr:FAD-dependent oxidoreductase [Clostridium bowmanii]